VAARVRAAQRGRLPAGPDDRDGPPVGARDAEPRQLRPGQGLPGARTGARFRHGHARGHPSLDRDVQRGFTRGRRTAAGSAACSYKPCEPADSGETQARPAESTYESEEALMLARLDDAAEF